MAVRFSSRSRRDSADEYLAQYRAIEEDFLGAVSSFGLEVASADENPADTPDTWVAPAGVVVENGRKSFSRGWISPSCVACRKGVGTETFLTSTQCPRSCYFCFNPNQADYEFFLTHERDVVAELEERYERGQRLDHIALTGGEPLLHADLSIAFFRRARELYPQARLRLYTSGAYLDPELIDRLTHAGLDEIRFSVKLDDAPAAMDQTLDRIAACVGRIPSVMVEMPVASDEVDDMQQLLVRLDSLGVDGINLLELCFPFNNAPEFAKRGYKVKSRPYRVLYDYWYAGGLPIAGSEEACLAVLDYAAENNLRIGVHYCSLENKLTGQVYQQNAPFKGQFPLHTMEGDDFFLKACKAFGADRAPVRDVLESAGMPYEESSAYDYIVFRLADADIVSIATPGSRLFVTRGIVEYRDDEPVFRELGIEPFARR